MEWADGTWCFRTELYEMNHMSDDYIVIPAFTLDWEVFLHIAAEIDRAGEDDGRLAEARNGG
jgi:hypothetical protein